MNDRAVAPDFQINAQTVWFERFEHVFSLNGVLMGWQGGFGLKRRYYDECSCFIKTVPSLLSEEPKKPTFRSSIRHFCGQLEKCRVFLLSFPMACGRPARRRFTWPCAAFM